MPVERKRLPSYDDLLVAVREVSRRVNREAGDRASIAGGFAMHVWGSSRMTGDLVVVAANDLGYDGDPLVFGGVRTREESVPLDVIVRSDEWRALYESALAAAVHVEGMPLSVVTPEYLVAMKMVAGRSKDEGDVRYLVLLEDFVEKRAENIVRRHLGPYAVKELRSTIAEARWRKSRGEEP